MKGWVKALPPRESTVSLHMFVVTAECQVSEFLWIFGSILTIFLQDFLCLGEHKLKKKKIAAFITFEQMPCSNFYREIL